jgi:hypothetical protein
VAEAEIALASRDLGWPTRGLDRARAVLESHGDRINAAHARYIEIRRLVLIGRLDEAEARLPDLEAHGLTLTLKTVHELAVAGIAMRRLQAKRARAALARADHAAREAAVPALAAEVENAILALDAPAAHLIAQGIERPVLLDDVEALLASQSLVVDACRHVVRDARSTISLARRPVLFALARALGEAWPSDVSRERLIAVAFGGKFTDDSQRARLRVEAGRLRLMLRPLAGVSATKRGFVLVPRSAAEVVVLTRPAEENHAALLALLGDGESWSSSALALALGVGRRTVQRALEQLATAGKVQSYGRARACRWVTPSVPGFATSLLLPGRLPGDYDGA